MSSFVGPITDESDEQFVYDAEEKHVDVPVPGSSFSHKQLLDVVV